MAWSKTLPANDELLVDTPAQLRANWEALELLTDAALQITNAKVAAAAGIVDTKLATISTANKVLGSAIGSLPSIPAGAGKVPVANIDTGTTANKIVILDGSGFLPAVSGTNLTGIPTKAITVGTMAPARLGGGTAAATTFLTGAGLWATIPEQTTVTQVNDTDTGTAFDQTPPNTAFASVAKTCTSGKTILMLLTGHILTTGSLNAVIELLHGTTVVKTVIASSPLNFANVAASQIVTGLSGSVTFSARVYGSNGSGTIYGDLIVLEF